MTVKLVRWNQIPVPTTHAWMARVEVGAQGGQGGRVGTVLKWRMYGQGKIGLFLSSSEGTHGEQHPRLQGYFGRVVSSRPGPWLHQYKENLSNGDFI